MTRSFWYHFAIAALLFMVAFAAVSLSGLAGTSFHRAFLPGRDVFPQPQLLSLLLSPVFLWVVARLTIRINRSYRTVSYLALYAVAVSLPVFISAIASPAAVISLTLLGLAIVDILDSRVAPKKTLYAGFYIGLGSVLDSSLIFVFLLILVPVFLIQRDPRGWLRFVAGGLAAVALSAPVVAILGSGAWPLPHAGLPWGAPSFDSVKSIVRGQMTPIRYFADTYFLAAYVPFAIALVAALTTRTARIDRSAVLLIVWLMFGVAILGGLGILPHSAMGVAQALTFILMIVAATVGAGLLETLNEERGARIWMWALGGLFMVPPLLGWAHLIARH